MRANSWRSLPTTTARITSAWATAKRANPRRLRPDQCVPVRTWSIVCGHATQGRYDGPWLPLFDEPSSICGVQRAARTPPLSGEGAVDTLRGRWSRSPCVASGGDIERARETQTPRPLQSATQEEIGPLVVMYDAISRTSHIWTCTWTYAPADSWRPHQRQSQCGRHSRRSQHVVRATTRGRRSPCARRNTPPPRR
jgi:hypothetical protein